jgi:hypothetical protein
MVINAQTAGAVFLAGLVNWLATYIIVAGVIFEGTRAKINAGCNRLVLFSSMLGTTSVLERAWSRLLSLLGTKLDYLVSCQLCCGVWVGFVLTAFAHGPFRSSVIGVAVLLNGLLIRAVGHIVLELTSLARNKNKLLTQQAKAHQQRLDHWKTGDLLEQKFALKS